MIRRFVFGVFRSAGTVLPRLRSLPGPCRLYTASRARIVATTSISSAVAAVYQYSESDSTLPEMPKEAVTLPGSIEELTHEFLIRQSCLISADSASKVVSHHVAAVEDTVARHVAVMAELANLYEDGVAALTDDGAQTVMELRARSAELKKTVADLELLSHFVKKLLEANAEACFLAGADFASVQASERLQSAGRALEALFEKSKAAEMDLVRAHQVHIGNVDRAIKTLEDRKKEKEEAEKKDTEDTEEAL